MDDIQLEAVNEALNPEEISLNVENLTRLSDECAVAMDMNHLKDRMCIYRHN